MNQDTQHRNKCQYCFRQIGKFILDCYCFLCAQCFAKQRSKNSSKCGICFKITNGKFIDTRDRQNMMKVNYLFGNFSSTLSKCLDVYKFQNEIDLRYCRYLENQLSRYKELLNNIISENPRLTDYVNAFFQKKMTPRKSASENLEVNYERKRQGRERRFDNSSLASRSKISPSVLSHHQMFVDAQRVNQGQKIQSAKISYKIPNINYNTALRNSKRSSPKRQDEEIVYYRR